MGEAAEADTTLRGWSQRKDASSRWWLRPWDPAGANVRFHLDDSIKRGDETLRLIEKSTAETRQREAQQVQHAAQDPPPALADNTMAREERTPGQPG